MTTITYVLIAALIIAIGLCILMAKALSKVLKAFDKLSEEHKSEFVKAMGGKGKTIVLFSIGKSKS